MLYAIQNPKPNIQTRLATYHRVTRTATYGFLSALPLLLLYEGMILLANYGQPGEVRVGADVWLRQLLALFGGTGLTALSVVVVLAGFGIVYYERDRYIPLRSRYFAGILGESAAYAVVLAFLVAGMVGAIFALLPVGAQTSLQQMGTWTQLALSIGAGFYEELLFRVLLVGGLYELLRRLTPEPARAYLTAAVVGALIFSAVHYVGPFGDVFRLSSFTFRFLFGLALNAVFLWRGFGVAAWTHALYDVMLVIGIL